MNLASYVTHLAPPLCRAIGTAKADKLGEVVTPSFCFQNKMMEWTEGYLPHFTINIFPTHGLLGVARRAKTDSVFY